jgi:large subunit ribosomal protein L30
MAETFRIRLIRRPIGFKQDQKATVRSLGLRRMQQVVELPDNPAVRGMVFKVRHLVRVVDA